MPCTQSPVLALLKHSDTSVCPSSSRVSWPLRSKDQICTSPATWLVQESALGVGGLGIEADSWQPFSRPAPALEMTGRGAGAPEGMRIDTIIPATHDVVGRHNNAANYLVTTLLRPTTLLRAPAEM